MDRLEISQTLLSDLDSKKSVSQSTLLMAAWKKIAKLAKHTDMKNERIIPFIAQDEKDIVMQYTVEVIDPEDYETFVSQMVPFVMDEGSYLSIQ